MNKTKSGGLLGKFKQLNIPGILIGDIVLFILFGLANSKFLSTYNIILIFRNTCTLLLAAIGLTLVILIGQIDMQVVWNREYMAAAQIVGFDHIMHGIFHPVRFSAGFQQPAANAGYDLQ